MPRYYKLNNRKITLREYWNIARSWTAIVAWIGSRFGFFQDGMGFRQPESMRELEVLDASFPADARAKLQPLLEECLGLGFHSPRFYFFENLRKDVRTSFISMLHRSGEMTIRLMHTLASNAHPPLEKALAVLLSELHDGTFFFTSNQHPTFKNPSWILNNRLVGASPVALIESHRQKLAGMALRNPARQVTSTAALDEVWERYEQLSTDYQLKRGLYVPMAAEDAEGQQKIAQDVQVMTNEGVPNAEVLVEIERLQHKKASWGNALIILAVSLFLFVGAGARGWSWSYLFILVPILFVHELGHYLAMRAFNYRNLRMFFIPFFGAAVSGQNYNVPGWKKVIVSLMGPVPGIFLGVILGIAGLLIDHSLLTQIGLMSLCLNGFNLLPVLPLDGGWVMHSLLFSRHALLDAVFRIAAVGALIALSMTGTSKIFLWLGIFMAMGIPLHYRMAKVVSRLRRGGFQSVSDDNQTIPPDTAQAIIAEVKQGLSKVHTPKMVAEQTLQIFELLNARPPGWPATIGLMFAHGASLAIAFIFAVVLVAGQRGGFQDGILPKTQELKRQFTCGEAFTWPAPNAAGAPGQRAVLVASFADQENALKAFRGLTNELPASASLATFGQSLFLTLPHADTEKRKQLFTKLQSLTEDVFVESTNNQPTFSLSCQFPDEETAEALDKELGEYLGTDPARSLIPPWIPNDPRTVAERAAHQLARRTYLKVERERWKKSDTPAQKALQKKIAAAQRQADESEIQKLSSELAALNKTEADERLDKLKSTGGGVDSELIDLMKSLPEVTTQTNRAAKIAIEEKLAQRMGQVSPEPGNGIPENRCGVRGGYTSRQDRVLKLNWLSFPHLAEGLPALANWLCIKGATNMRYEIHLGMPFTEDLERE